MSGNAFGIDHGTGISKARNAPPSTGRRLTGQIFGPYHGLVAGKPGKKLKAAGTNLGYGLGGGILGGAAGAALGAATHNAEGGAIVGNTIGSVAGTQHSITVNSRKGRYKRES